MVKPLLILFDCIDTLLEFRLNDERPYWQGMGEVAQKLGLYDSAHAFGEVYGRVRDQALNSIEEKETTLQERLRTVFLNGSSRDIRFSEDLLLPIISRFKKDYADCVEPEPGVFDMLDAWKGKVSMGVVSNFFLKDMPAYLLKRKGLDHYFDFILDSAAIGWRKPSQKIYYQALEISKFPKEKIENVLFIGDNPIADVQAPLELGMQAIHYKKEDDGQKKVPTIHHWDDFRPDQYE